MIAVCDQFMYIASDDVKEPVRLSYNTDLTTVRDPAGANRVISKD